MGATLGVDLPVELLTRTAMRMPELIAGSLADVNGDRLVLAVRAAGYWPTVWCATCWTELTAGQ